MNDLIFFFFYNFAHRSVFFDNVIIFTDVYLPYTLIFVAGIFLLFYHKVLPSRNPFKEFINKWKGFLYVPFSCMVAWILAKLLKVLFHTQRPFSVFPDVHPLFNESSFAFPSQHAIFFTALAVSLYFYNKKVGYLFMFLALLIGIARIIAGVHFPVDILGGFILGGLVAYFVKTYIMSI